MHTENWFDQWGWRAWLLDGLPEHRHPFQGMYMCMYICLHVCTAVHTCTLCYAYVWKVTDSMCHMRAYIYMCADISMDISDCVCHMHACMRLHQCGKVMIVCTMFTYVCMRFNKCGHILTVHVTRICACVCIERHWLYVSYVCMWSHRCRGILIALYLLSLRTCLV